MEAIHRALELGVNWIDTAAAYGFGRSEEVVGRVLEGVSERPYVFTKASLLEGPGRRVVHNLKRDSIVREAHASLERLGVDARHDTVPGAVAIAWTLHNPAVNAAIVGFRSRQQVDPLISAANLQLTNNDIHTIEGHR